MIRFLILIAFCFGSDLFSQNLRVSDVRKRYLNFNALDIKADISIKDADKINVENGICYLRLNRIDKKDFEILYYDPSSVCILKDKTTGQKIKYFNRFTDSIEYFSLSRGEIRNCYQFTGVNLSAFENPFSDCFYHTINLQNKSQLLDLGDSYYYEFTTNYIGFQKRIWVNKVSLMVDSIEYDAGKIFKKIKYSYMDDLNILDSFHNRRVSFEFDSLMSDLRSKVILNNLSVIDTFKLLSDLNSDNKLVLLDFWYIGCEPCVKAFPKIQAIRDSFSSSFLTIRAVNNFDNSDNIQFFKNRHNFTFDIEKDENNLTDFYNVNVFPTLLLIDQKGVVLFKIEGINNSEFLKLLSELRFRFY